MPQAAADENASSSTSHSACTIDGANSYSRTLKQSVGHRKPVRPSTYKPIGRSESTRISRRPVSESFSCDKESVRRTPRPSLAAERCQLITFTKSIETRFDTGIMVELVRRAATKNSVPNFIHFVACFQDVHKLVFKDVIEEDYIHLLDPNKIDVVRDLPLIESMYRAERTVCQSRDIQLIDIEIHGCLMRMRIDMEERYEELRLRGRTLHVNDFIAWIYSQYPVGGSYLRPRKRQFRHNPDSLHGHKSDIEDAIISYTKPGIATELGPTSAMANAIVEELKKRLESYEESSKARRRRRGSVFRVFAQRSPLAARSPRHRLRQQISGDRLVCRHPLPHG